MYSVGRKLCLNLALQEVADGRGHLPSVSDVANHCRYPLVEYVAGFGSYPRARSFVYDPQAESPKREAIIRTLYGLEAKHRDRIKTFQLPELVISTPYRVEHFVDTFGSAQAALVAAGILSYEVLGDAEDTTVRREYERAFARAIGRDIHLVAEALDKIPSAREYSEYGSFPVAEWQRVHKRWLSMLLEAGFPVKTIGVENLFDEDDLVYELRRLGTLLGRRPRGHDIHEFSVYSWDTFTSVSPWNELLEKAGYDESSTATTSIPETALATEYVRVLAIVGRKPTYDELKEHAAYHPRTLVRRFGDLDTAHETILAGDASQVGDIPDFEAD